MAIIRCVIVQYISVEKHTDHQEFSDSKGANAMQRSMPFACCSCRCPLPVSASVARAVTAFQVKQLRRPGDCWPTQGPVQEEVRSGAHLLQEDQEHLTLADLSNRSRCSIGCLPDQGHRRQPRCSAIG